MPGFFGRSNARAVGEEATSSGETNALQSGVCFGRRITPRRNRRRRKALSRRRKRQTRLRRFFRRRSEFGSASFLYRGGERDQRFAVGGEKDAVDCFKMRMVRGNREGRRRAAVVKRVSGDFFDAIGNLNRGQRLAPGKRSFSDFFDAIRNFDRDQRGVPEKRALCDFFDAIWNFDRGQRGAPDKRVIANFFDAIWNFDRGQRGAPRKRFFADFNDRATVDFRRNDDRSRAFVKELDDNDAVVFDSRFEVARRICGSAGFARGGVGRFVGGTLHFILRKRESRGKRENERTLTQKRRRPERVEPPSTTILYGALVRVKEKAR